MRKMLSFGLVLATMMFVLQLALNAQPAPPPKSPEVSADGRVTFRFVDPNAKQVTVLLEGKTAPDAMTRDDRGIWTFTTQTLAPDSTATYSFQTAICAPIP